MRRVIVPNNFFEEAAEALKQGKSVKIHVDGQSMYPFIRGGSDQVEIEPYHPSDELSLWCCPFYQWKGNYMIHRYIGKHNGFLLMMGDGNIHRTESIRQEEVIGILRFIYHPDGCIQDCKDQKWLKRGERWYRLRKIRRFLLPVFRIISF